MKTKILATLLFSILITGCQKQPEPQTDLDPTQNPAAKLAFEQADKKIGKFLDQLDSASTTQEVRTKILCHDYPTFYKKEYVPAFLKLSPDYTEQKLLSDLNFVLDYYKKKTGVQC